MLMLLRLLGWTAIVAIAILSLVPGELRPHIGTPHYFDHFAAYCLTAAVLALAYRGRLSDFALFAWLTAYAGALETAQLWVPGRMAQISDFSAGLVGSLVGIVAINAVHWISRRRRNQIG